MLEIKEEGSSFWLHKKKRMYYEKEIAQGSLII